MLKGAAGLALGLAAARLPAVDNTYKNVIISKSDYL